MRVLLLIERSGAFEREVLDGIGRYAHEVGGWSFVNHRSRTIDAKQVPPLHVDGIIAHHDWGNATLRRIGLPAVVVTKTTPKRTLPCVTCDDRAISEVAADVLLSIGVQAFAYAGFETMRRSETRYRHFVDALRRRLGDTPVHRFEDLRFAPQEHTDTDRVAAWLTSLPRPVGLFAANDRAAEELFEGIAQTDLRVPDDIAVVGVDNDESVADFTHASLSSIDPDAHRIGYEAAAMLDRIHRDGKAVRPREVMIPPLGVIHRQSTDVMHHRDPAVARALSFIREHLQRPDLSVARVVEASGVSRGTLFRRFNQALGQPIQAEIDQQKLQRVLDYVRNTDLSLTRIAILCGFPDLSALSIFVRRRLGRPPSALR